MRKLAEELATSGNDIPPVKSGFEMTEI